MSPQDSCYDFLILGQGLAGSFLAWRLVGAGKRVLVVDDGHRSSSSQVAAGLVNPLAGMRFNRAARTRQWLDSAHALYRALEQHFGRRYFHPVGMLRLLRSPQQQRFHQRALENPHNAALLDPLADCAQIEPGVIAAHGGFRQHQTGYLEIPDLLADLRDWLVASGSYRQLRIDYADIRLNEGGIDLQGLQAAHLVCCEGYRMQHNPWFSKLPLAPDKGEILLLDSPRVLCRHIVNGAHWMIPLVEGGYRFGSTHEHRLIDNAPTRAAREQLLTGLQQLLTDTGQVQIRRHQAGVRPATSDRQPFLGTHPHLPRLHLFNGFGARGALSIPWFAKQFTQHLLHGHPLPTEADLTRYAGQLDRA